MRVKLKRRVRLVIKRRKAAGVCRYLDAVLAAHFDRSKAYPKELRLSRRSYEAMREETRGLGGWADFPYNYRGIKISIEGATVGKNGRRR